VAKLTNYNKINEHNYILIKFLSPERGRKGDGRNTPASGIIARKFITNTKVGLTSMKCRAIPTGIKTNKRLAQLQQIIVLSSS